MDRQEDSIFKMRALILFSLIGYVLGRPAATGIDSSTVPTTKGLNLVARPPGWDTPLEGTNTTTNSAMTVPKPEITTERPVTWNGFWVPIENTLGFPPRVKEDKKSRRKRAAPSEAVAQDDPKKEEDDDIGHWNNLNNSFGFPTEQPDADQVPANTATPMKWCNMTVNSATTNSSLCEKGPEPGKDPKPDVKLPEKTAVQTSTPKKIEDDDMGIWHNLNNSFGFPTEQPHVDQKKQS